MGLFTKVSLAMQLLKWVQSLFTRPDTSGWPVVISEIDRLLILLEPKQWIDFNIYSRADRCVFAIAADAQKVSIYLKELAFRLEANENITRVIDQFKDTSIPVHEFFTSEELYCLDAFKYIEEIRNSTWYLCKFMKQDWEHLSSLQRSNYALLLTQLESIKKMLESLLKLL